MPECAQGDEKVERRGISRRRFLLRAVGMGVGGVAAVGGGAAYARHVEPFWPAVEQVDMDLPGLAGVWVGKRMLQLSDLHVGRGMPTEYLREQVAGCAVLEPDVVVLTGDYVTMGATSGLDALKEIVGQLRPPLGVYAVLGNHDFGVYSPARRPRGTRSADRVTEALAAGGVDVLRGAVRRIDCDGAALQLVGVDDLWSGFFDVEAAFAGVDEALPTVVLSHNPDTVEVLQKWPGDWILCGHTHGGQVRVPLWGAPILPIKHKQYDQGRFELGDKRLYVNRGLGYLRRVRFNCRPEITLFTLRRRA